IWLFVNCTLGISSWRLSRHFFPGGPLLSQTIHTIIVAWALIVLTVIFLGTVGLLFAPLLLTSVTAASAIILWAVRDGGHDRINRPGYVGSLLRRVLRLVNPRAATSWMRTPFRS